MAFLITGDGGTEIVRKVLFYCALSFIVRCPFLSRASPLLRRELRKSAGHV